MRCLVFLNVLSGNPSFVSLTKTQNFVIVVMMKINILLSNHFNFCRRHT